jgi:hypothetical protein
VCHRYFNTPFHLLNFFVYINKNFAKKIVAFKSMASFTHNDTVDVKDYGEKNDDFLNTITDYSREAELARLYDMYVI